MAWDRVLQPYLKNEQVFTCPSKDRPQSYTYNAQLATSGRPLAGIDSPAATPVFADAVGSGTAPTTCLGPDAPYICATGSNPRQSLAFWMGDFSGPNSGRVLSNRFNPSAGQWNTSRQTPGEIDPIVHSEGANYGFADGHVKWYKARMLSGVPKPPSEGLDYNGDGVVGDGSNWR